MTQLILSVLAPLVLLSFMPGAGELTTELHTTTNPTTALGDVALLIAVGVIWLLLAWSTVVIITALCLRIPGIAGAVSARLLHQITPAALRHVVFAAVGVSLIASASACASQPAAPSAPLADPTAAAMTLSTSHADALPSSAAPASPLGGGGGTGHASEGDAQYIPNLDWPATVASPSTGLRPANPAGDRSLSVANPAPQDATSAGPPSLPHLADQTATTTPSTAHLRGDKPERVTKSRPDSHTTAEIVVHRGDTLWSIASQRLPDDATAAEITASWHQWYRINQTVIGSNPNLLLPGQRLAAPPTVEEQP